MILGDNKAPVFSNINNNTKQFIVMITKVSKYGVISGPYFPAFELNVDTFHAAIGFYTMIAQNGDLGITATFKLITKKEYNS